MWIIATILIYFAVLLVISRLTQRRATNDTFFRANRQSPWYMVAFGMVGASISGVTFVSVPGMVLTSQMTYLQVCLGFIVGYLAVAFVLLPVYYKLNLTSIYAYLGQRLGQRSYHTGKFYVVCMILQQFVCDALGVPFALTVSVMVLLIWLYTRQGGVRTLVFTDMFQTLCLFSALLIIIFMVMRQMDFSLMDAVRSVTSDERSRIFVMDQWQSPHYFWKQFLSGAFIVIVMTGLDQDMMQKNLTCRTLREAQKDMCSYGVAFVLLPVYYKLNLTSIYAYLGQRLGQRSYHTGASFSSADSALTSLTTSYCVDIKGRVDDERLRKHAHLAICALFVVFILLFHQFNHTSLIDAIYTIVSYTYGPLLGLFAFGLFTRHQVHDRWVPLVCVASPIICYAADCWAQQQWNYHFGYELLMINGLLTFVALRLLARSAGCQTSS